MVNRKQAIAAAQMNDRKRSSSTLSNMTASRHEETNSNLKLERIISQAFDGGHDADIPSAEGYVLDETGEKKRRASL